jgi:O-antigen ligase
VSWLGWPEFGWSLTLFGLCVYTFAVVTFKAPVGNAGAVIAIVGLLLQREKLRIPFPVWLFGSFLLWAFISSFASPYTDLVLNNLFEQLKLLIIMLVVVNALRTEGQLRFYLMFFLGCFVLFPVRGTLVGGDRIQGRAVWNFIYNNPNDLATLCLLCLGVALAVLFFAPRRLMLRLGAAASVLLLIVVMFLTESRGAFIGLMAGMGWGLIRLGLKRPILTLVLGSFVALVLSLTIPPTVWARLSGIEKLTSTSTIAEADPEGSAEERFEIQRTAWRIFVDHPIFGVGFGMYRRANAKYAPSLGEKDTHNTYLNLAAETGLPGLILWSTLAFSVLRYAYRVRKKVLPGHGAAPQAWLERAIFGYLVAAIFGTYVMLSFPYIMLAILWCSAKLQQSSSNPLAEAKERKSCVA